MYFQLSYHVSRKSTIHAETVTVTVSVGKFHKTLVTDKVININEDWKEMYFFKAELWFIRCGVLMCYCRVNMYISHGDADHIAIDRSDHILHKHRPSEGGLLNFN